MKVNKSDLIDEERILQQYIAEGTEPQRGINPAELPPTYSKALQGKGINGIIASSTTNGGIQLNALTHAGTMESEGVLITIEEQAIKDITPQTFKVLIILLTKVTAQLPRQDQITPEAIVKGRTIKISIDEYMEICKIKDKKEARNQLNDAINALYAFSLEWEEPKYRRPEGKVKKVKETIPYRLRIIEKTAGNAVKNNVAEVTFSYDMAEYLSASYMMPYPSALLRVNTRYNPYSIPLGWKLCSHSNMNFGKQNANRISVSTLLQAAKGIPRYESVSARGAIFQKIIAPFDRDLNALVNAEVLASYTYYDEDGNPVDRERLGSYSYYQFSKFSVGYELRDYPEAMQAHRIDMNQKRISAAISRNAKKTKTQMDGKEDGAQP